MTCVPYAENAYFVPAVDRSWFTAGVVLSSACAAATLDETRNYIRDILAQPSIQGINGAELNALRTFYNLRGDAPAWTGSPQAEADGQILQAALAQASADGLNAADYRIIPMVGYGAATNWLDAEKDVLETNAALRYANDLRDGRPWLARSRRRRRTAGRLFRCGA